MKFYNMKNRRSYKNICLSPNMCDPSGQYTGNAFWNEMKSVFSCTASQHWSCELREHCCWIRLRQLKKVIGAADSCASWSTLVRWAERRRWPGVPSESKLKVHGRCAFSFECKIDFRKLFVGSPGNEDSNTKIAKVPQAVQAVFFLVFFFFTIFVFFSFAKKLTRTQMRPRNVAVLTSQSFIRIVCWHWPQPAPSAFFHNNVTWQYTLHILT